MNTIKKSDSFDWQVELLRFTGFPMPDAHIEHLNWWKDIVGESSETRLIQTRKGLFQDKGPFEKGELLLKVEPFRIDWLYRSTQNPEEEDQRISLGLFQETIKNFVDLINKWFTFKDFPPLQRAAFGAIIYQPVETDREGYEKLSEYLKPSVKLDPDGSSDFIYQINRPRDFNTDIANLKINRLMKWSVRRIRFIGFVFDEEQKDIFKGQETYACRLELDINTVPDPRICLNAKECQAIFNEFVNMAREISQKGDIK